MIYNKDILSPVQWETFHPVGTPLEVYYNEERLTFYWRDQEDYTDEAFWQMRLGSTKYIIIGNSYVKPMGWI